MAATAMRGAGRRHRVVATGSGFGRLTATKALRHAETDITDALTFLTRIAAHATAHVHHHMALWLQVVQATLAAFTAVGVLFTLYIAIGRCRPQQIEKGWR